MAKKHRKLDVPVLDDFSPAARRVLHTIRSNAAAIAHELSEEQAKAWITDLLAPLSTHDRKLVLAAIVHDEESRFARGAAVLLKGAMDPSLSQVDRIRLAGQVARWRLQLDEGRATAEKLLGEGYP